MKKKDKDHRKSRPKPRKSVVNNHAAPRSTSDSDLHFASGLSSEPDFFFENMSRPLTVNNVSAGSSRPRQSTACAKVLVRAGLRCRCHFIYVSRFPFVEFAPMPAPQD